MENSSIGIIGAKGRLGSKLVEKGCIGLNCNITDIESLKQAFGNGDFETVINCAAFTDVDGAEKERLSAYGVNSYGPQNIAKYFSGKIVHISSDYIFDGLNGPYSEDDVANPLNAYGFSKYLGEVSLRPYMDRTLVIRTTVLYDSGNKNNFIRAVHNQLLEDKAVKVPKTIIGNPTNVEHLAIGILDAIDKNITGILNISGKTRMSRFETAVEIARFFNLDTKNIFDSPAWGDAKRPEQVGFVLDKAQKLGVPLFTLWQGLHEYKHSMEPKPLASDVENRLEIIKSGIELPFETDLNIQPIPFTDLVEKKNE
jgi:dTDP-4-dehydrorhamnose reductase